jgi:hypothetical protein
MDRFGAVLSATFRGVDDWANLRRWLLPQPAGVRIIPDCIWYDDDEHRINVLANIPSACSMCGNWSWLPLRTKCCLTFDLLYHKDHNCHRDCCCRKWYWYVRQIPIWTNSFTESDLLFRLIGGTIHPILLHKLTPIIGFAWAVRVLAFLIMATLLVPLIVMRVRLLPPTRRRILDLTAWKEPAYAFYVLGCACAFLGTWTPFFYIDLYALDRKFTSPESAFYLLAVITAGSTFGRLGPNILAAKIGMYNVLIPFAFLTGILSFCLIPVTNVGELSAVGVLYGIFSGALVSITPTIAVQLSPVRTVIGARMGMAFATIGIGMLIGTPIAGSLLNKYGFTAAFSFSGASAITGSLILFVSRGFYCGWSVVKKV